jgi:uncharacterized protein (DUF885 family)
VALPPEDKLSVEETPSYLQSLRATGSYRAPLTGQADMAGVFYITPEKENLQLVAGHCPYLSAHETYPGHHVLDHVRIHHPNAVRRQIESPIVYEGWACYAEQLVDELGYVTDPRRQLVEMKRQLWRGVRAVLDIKLHTGRIGREEAATEIEALGYPPGIARRQVRRFCMTPGYQLGYFMGMVEILQLRDRFSSAADLSPFHDAWLSGGQIPFHLAEKRLAGLQNSTG